MRNSIMIAKELVRIAKSIIATANDGKIFSHSEIHLKESINPSPRDRYEGCNFVHFNLECPKSFGREELMTLIRSFNGFDGVKAVSGIDVSEETSSYYEEQVPVYDASFTVYFNKDILYPQDIVSVIVSSLKEDGFKMEPDFEL